MIGFKEFIAERVTAHYNLEGLTQKTIILISTGAVSACEILKGSSSGIDSRDLRLIQQAYKYAAEQQFLDPKKDFRVLCKILDDVIGELA